MGGSVVLGTPKGPHPLRISILIIVSTDTFNLSLDALNAGMLNDKHSALLHPLCEKVTSARSQSSDMNQYQHYPSNEVLKA